eukprot:695226-Rhodomonas_salina.1
MVPRCGLDYLGSRGVGVRLIHGPQTHNGEIERCPNASLDVADAEASKRRLGRQDPCDLPMKCDGV